MIDTTMNQLLDLRLSGIRESLNARLGQARKDGLGHDEFLSLVLQDETDYRNSSRIKRLLRKAAFRQAASLEDIDLTVPRSLDKKQLRDLSTCRFVMDGVNILIMGPTGIGKTYLATAIGNSGCRAGYSVLFYRMNTLIEQLQLARAKASYLNLLKRLAACDLLILDDFGIKPLDANQFQDLYDVIDERGEEKSTIITSQVPPENWSEIIADPVTCEAITDRLSAVTITIEMKGPSYRPNRRRGRTKLDKD
jgi:DNA replication protein DnaC